MYDSLTLLLTKDMSVFDALGYLTNYLKEAHTSGRHHLADLYELVQYAGNIVPRLYLMITVGSVYMGMEASPIKEIMRDMMEMSRGVQHPIRGLFLRHYLSGQTKDFMPIGQADGVQGNLQDSIQFTLTNFIEMNKLWVRLQHQGHSRDRQLREMERTELKTLVGTNLVRLSQLDGIDLSLYTGQILPAVLEQVIQCRDVLAQEYLLEVITQVYPDEYHLRTLDQILSAIAKLNPHVNVKQIVIQIIDRLAGYAAREAEEKNGILEDSVKEVTTKLEETDVNGESASSTAEVKDATRGIPADVKLFDIFWQQVLDLVKLRNDLKIQDISAMLVSLSNLVLNCYPNDLDYMDKIMTYALAKTEESANSTDLHSNEAKDNLLKLLLAPITAYKSLVTVFAIPSYMPLLDKQSYSIRRSVAASVADSLLQRQSPITTKSETEGIFGLLKVLIADDSEVANGRERSGRGNGDNDDVIEEQGWLARIVHFITNDDLEANFELLLVARNALVLGGERTKYTFPALVMSTLKLARKWKSREHLSDSWSSKSSAVFKFVHQAVSTVYQCPNTAESSLRLFLYAGQIADQCEMEEVSYEFFAQAYTVYEDSISESKAQYQAVCTIVSALQQTRSFSRDNYDTLITKSALHGAKLLKKPDQTRAILAASHLWCATDIPARGEEDEKTLYRDDKRVLECLQKALKIADACMDTAVSIQLFVEILNQYIYYFDKQNDAVCMMKDELTSDCAKVYQWPHRPDQTEHGEHGTYEFAAKPRNQLGI